MEYVSAIGMIDLRILSFGACKDKAKVTFSCSLDNLIIAGMIPHVDIVIFLWLICKAFSALMILTKPTTES